MIVFHPFNVFGRLPCIESKCEIDALRQARFVSEQRMQPMCLTVVAHDKQRAMYQWNVQVNKTSTDLPLAFQRKGPLST
jgi:hypothetical protein